VAQNLEVVLLLAVSIRNQLAIVRIRL